MASLFHPLCGSNPDTLWQLFTQQGGVSRQRIPQAAIALSVALARWPFSFAEQLLAGNTADPDMPPPVFIVGYWRSGTTHLHNVLSKADTFGYITPLATGLPQDILGIVRTLEPLLEKALPHDRYVDNVAVTPDSPQEDAIPLASMGAASYYHGMYFPKHFRHHFNRGVFFEGCDAQEIEQWQRYHVQLLNKVSIHQKSKQLVIKNPVYTAHIAKLQALWPKAKFIHIYRNPYIVFRSTRHFFLRLLPELALQDYDETEIAAQVDDLILNSYPRMITALQTGSANLPNNSFAEIRFEDFEKQPLQELARVYETLGLEDFTQAKPQFEAYLNSLQGYQKNTYTFAPEMIQTVEQRWLPFIQQWSYEKPR